MEITGLKERFPKLFKAALKNDPAARSLIASNVLTAAAAILQHWPLAELVFIYWLQALIIGFFNFIRILTLENDFTVNGIPVTNFRSLHIKPFKMLMAVFFMIHYGFFQVGYFRFFSHWDDFRNINFSSVFIFAAIFFLNHLYSFGYNFRKDRKGQGLIGVMLLPYFRIIPMNLVIFTGGIFMRSSFISGALKEGMWFIPFLIFVVSKTFADVAMHVLEHEQVHKAVMFVFGKNRVKKIR